MKIITILIFIISNTVYAKDYIYEVGGQNETKKDNIIIYPNGKKFIVINGEYAAWKDNKGDYGKERCIGYVLLVSTKMARSFGQLEIENLQLQTEVEALILMLLEQGSMNKW